MSRRPVVLLVTLVGVLLGTLLVGPAGAADPVPPVNQTAPVVSGTARVGETLQATRGTWLPEPTTYSYRWLRDGVPIAGAYAASYRLAGADRQHRISVRVTASTEVAGEPAVSTETEPVGYGRFALVARPTIEGPRRWQSTLRINPGAWTPAPTSYSYLWMREDRPIPGATGATYKLTLADYGKHIQVRVSPRRADYANGVVYSYRTGPVTHRVPVRKRFTYSVVTRGAITADLQQFLDLTAASYADPRGWRSAGYEFTRVAKGGNFTLVLSSAAKVPSFGYPCSSTWSCRVGRYVIINQARWLHASPAWNAAGLALRDYRHMVLNHETGHWLGHRHRGCPGKGRQAPVMMQQSKGLGGCRFNPFPLPSERWTSH